MLYRVFPLLQGAGPADDGGPLFVARQLQGSSRHDNPDHYGALYTSRARASAVAEYLQRFRGQELHPRHFRRPDKRPYALASIDDARLQRLVDLDDPAELVARSIRPSSVATFHRTVTQPIALGTFREGAVGLEWWSALEASWANVTIFAERAAARLAIGSEPELLTIEHPAVREAADFLGLGFS